MKNPKYIVDQIRESKSIKSTSIYLRQLVFFIVDMALKQHYGANYAVRCMQSCEAIHRILKTFGIGSKLFCGSLCVPLIYLEDPPEAKWGGFWDEDHHIWLATEHGELVDLTISQLHIHPAASRNDGLAIPAFWWSPSHKWPPMIKYLPDGPITFDLPEQDMEDLERFNNLVDNCMDEVIKGSSANDITYKPILYGPSSLQQLAYEHPWLINCLVFQEENIPLPDWIVAKENELAHKCGSY